MADFVHIIDKKYGEPLNVIIHFSNKKKETYDYYSIIDNPLYSFSIDSLIVKYKITRVEITSPISADDISNNLQNKSKFFRNSYGVRLSASSVLKSIINDETPSYDFYTEKELNKTEVKALEKYIKDFIKIPLEKEQDHKNKKLIEDKENNDINQMKEIAAMNNLISRYQKQAKEYLKNISKI